MNEKTRERCRKGGRDERREEERQARSGREREHKEKGEEKEAKKILVLRSPSSVHTKVLRLFITLGFHCH